jgi:enolase-phosphatase E1
VVLDIEGTTGSLSHVRGVLFPYAGARMGTWFATKRGTGPWEAVVAGVHAQVGHPELDEAALLAVLGDWSDPS